MSEGNNKSNFTLQSIGQKLQAIANKWNIVAIVTNQMTTKIKGRVQGKVRVFLVKLISENY